MQYLVALALATLVLFLAFIALLAIGVAGIYAGHRPGKRWTSATAFVTGCTVGAAILMGWPEPWLIVPFFGLGALVTYRLAARRHWRLAGLVAVGAAIPWTALAAARLLDPATFAAAFAAAPALPSFVGGVVAIGLGSVAVARGDRGPQPPHHLNPPGAPGSRRVGNLSARMLGDRAIAGIDVTSAVAWLAGLTGALTAQSIAERVALPGPGPVVVGVGVFALVATEAGFIAFPPRQRHALEALYWLRRQEQADFVATRGGTLPTSVKAAQAWLGAHPEPTDGGAARVDVIAWTGDLEAARTAIEALPDDSPLEGFTKTAQRAWVDWMDGRSIDLGTLGAAARAVGAAGSPERLRAETVVATIESQVVASSDGDWTAPLRAIRARLGHRADGALSRTYRPALLRVNLYIGAAFAIGATLIPRLPA
ncbi:MAG TPA: hypothetical protein VKA85_12650 [Candidatus Limnocylindrales bacterium]|nr:hypothetical protein [Candidatus Limnocylindrales bacterium]